VVTLGLQYGVEGISATYDLACQHNVKDGFMIGFRGQYVLDALTAMSGTDVQFCLPFAAFEPTIINDVSDPSFRVVLMPMRVT
jgi:DNA polymerase III sliding clamp (beta) subunit (PCNA family)